jgi:hypothetical protein
MAQASTTSLSLSDSRSLSGSEPMLPLLGAPAGAPAAASPSLRRWAFGDSGAGTGSSVGGESSAGRRRLPSFSLGMEARAASASAAAASSAGMSEGGRRNSGTAALAAWDKAGYLFKRSSGPIKRWDRYVRITARTLVCMFVSTGVWVPLSFSLSQPDAR